MPTTSVAKISGATSDLTNLKKILPKRSISRENTGKSIPTSTPKIMDEKIQ
jgi:hypothetical protein